MWEKAMKSSLYGPVGIFVCGVGLVDGVGEALTKHDGVLIGRLLRFRCNKAHLVGFVRKVTGVLTADAIMLF